VSIASTGVSYWEKSGSGPARAAYSIPEVAEKLGVCEASVWRALGRGQLESIKFGGRRLITARSLEKLLTTKTA